MTRSNDLRTYWAELRIFLEVAETGSFNRAAISLGVSHPTIGRAVRRLEDAIGRPLLSEVYARGVELTPLGTRLAWELSRFDRQLSRMLEKVLRT